MLKAVDGNGKEISIDDTNDRDKYYCPDCNQELITRKGMKRIHHFAHRKGSIVCTDSWNREHVYDYETSWHKHWQDCFPKENREVRLTFGTIRHRGDIVVGNTVLELQHTPITSKPFDERTRYYHSCDCKVIWLFDFIKAYENGDLETRADDCFVWNSFKRTFKYLDEATGQVEIFFQYKEGNDEEKSIIQVEVGRIHDKSNYFKAIKYYTKEEFLTYIGKKEDGSFSAPNLTIINQDPVYQSFKEKYNIQLDSQQERALQHFDGATLLTAVPGSGKTTTLVARLGYMTISKGVDPSKVLALTYTNAAVDKMKSDYCDKFGEFTGNQISFRTINSICNEIVKASGSNLRLINERDKKELLRSLYKSSYHTFPSESDIVSIETEIEYIKNMMIPESEIHHYDWYISKLPEIYNQYQNLLRNRGQMDFDDQLLIALDILKNNENLCKQYQVRYQHICVDEVQDTSKIQHEIIRLLVGNNNNIFMVGDEDQSIYGYRGAYPQALYEFDHTYLNPFHLSLETNYRSSKEIVDAANKIIVRNPGRRPKNMVSNRGEGGVVNYAEVDTRSGQLDFLVEQCKDPQEDMAIIYRNNETAVGIIDAFERNNIPYYLNKATELFFTSRLLSDIATFLKFALDPSDQQLFLSVYYKLNERYFAKEMAENACYWSRRNGVQLLDQFIEQVTYVKNKTQKYKDHCRSSAERFKIIIHQIASSKPKDAIDLIITNGYSEYATEKEVDMNSLESIRNIAYNTESIPDFLKRIEELNDTVQKKINNSERQPGDIVLSTIHSCKGMEFSKIIIVDAINGILPSKNALYLENDARFGYYAEERRLFYVAMTRAKDKLTIIKIKDEEQDFVSELVRGYNSYPCIYRTKKKDIQEPELNTPSTEERLIELFGPNGFDIVKDEEPVSHIIDMPSLKIEPVIIEEWNSLSDLWDKFSPHQYMIVENKDGEKYKIKQSPEETYNEFVDCCYGEEYGPGLQGRAQFIRFPNKRIWKRLYSK